VHLWQAALDLMEMAIASVPEDTVIVRSELGFNLWAGKRTALLDLGGFDEKFVPCGGEDEDMLLRVAKAGLRWSHAKVPAMHIDGGHKARCDFNWVSTEGLVLGYHNVPYFITKWGFPPHSKEYDAIVMPALGPKAVAPCA